MPEFTQKWFERNIPVWEKVFAPLVGQPLRYLEIGSFEGMSVCWMLEHVLTHSDSRATCIDPFESDEELKEADWKEIKERFLKNTEQFGSKSVYGGKLHLRELPSRDALLDLLEERESFDIVYIDGSHLAKDVLIDAVLSDQLLKSGGILIFDDYLWSNLHHNYGVPRPAIDAFMECFANEYDLVTSGYQVILKKK